ncbi:MAG: hypothetical protein FJ297_12990 [Planctomycetes bacterium]|nr:hypothetical protein [Planctomycetota bacterium]
MARSEPAFRLGPFRFLATHIEIQGRPNVEAWLEPLAFALWCQRASPWWIGDLLNAGDERFGEAFSQACEGLISGEQLQRYESIARRVPQANRRAALSWSAHAAVARLSGDLQREVLELAERHGWDSVELRRRARAAQQGEPWRPDPGQG